MRATFYLPDESDLDRVRALDPDRDVIEFTRGQRAWVLQTYLRLAAAGHPVDIAKEPHNHREFYGTGVVVTAENIDAFLKNAENPAPIDYDDFWGRVQGQIRYL